MLFLRMFLYTGIREAQGSDSQIHPHWLHAEVIINMMSAPQG